MLIKSLSLKDFKCFEQVDIDFGKITLLTGANSSGKSSLIYALLGIMQSKYFPQYFALNGELINMGGFDEVLRKKAGKREFEIGIRVNRKTFIEWDEDFNSPDLEYNTTWVAGDENEQPELQEIYSNGEGPYTDSYIELNANHFNYIGSFRLPPERTYYRKPNASKVGVNGEGYIDQIIKWEESDKKKYNELIEAVTEMGLFKTIQANKMKGGRFELNVQVNENSELSSLTDVGFGISQFLPIIVADLQMEDDSCLAISQPEIHLHPKIQATLGDYFCKQVNHTDKQYIVETHSEYLINRMRLLVVKGELKPEDVKLYYMENDGIKTTTYAIELTTDGQIKNAPQGFFDTYEMDVMDIALYASA
jgi:predicted ATPase